MDMQVEHLATPAETAIGLAIHTILATLPENTEMLFYRDDDAPATLELTHPDGRVEIAVATPTTDDLLIEPAAPAVTATTWRQLDVDPPEPLTDVLLWQVLAGFSPEEGNTLNRIGYRNNAGQYMDSYASAIDGGDEVLNGVTHWAPLPAGPLFAGEPA